METCFPLSHKKMLASPWYGSWQLFLIIHEKTLLCIYLIMKYPQIYIIVPHLFLFGRTRLSSPSFPFTPRRAVPFHSVMGCFLSASRL
jgi:hypothetical protein